MGSFFKNNGFSLVEAMVAGTIFLITMTGVFASLAAVQKPTGDANKSLGAAYCGQHFLEDLRASVDGRDWNSPDSKLAPGVGSVICRQNEVDYTVAYQITQVGTARKATVTVSWP
ncbi:MAG: prepilin-type N-terminal cleavage/methylation domain-containing protein [Candidatus Omnitrophica bacterium]|nr:prepilin-type N-terminal cleavage/methylation domain-containing protein [Candidatus Omnitrophota bacterium]